MRRRRWYSVIRTDGLEEKRRERDVPPCAGFQGALQPAAASIVLRKSPNSAEWVQNNMDG